MDHYSERLVREIQTLQRCETRWKLPAKPIIDQLAADSNRSLPDVIPVPPNWVRFDWPESGVVDLAAFWRAVDKTGLHSRWTGEYL